MPVYEFYCPDCHTIFNFLSRSVNTEARPDCPRCQRPRLDRRASSFAISRGRKEAEKPDGLPDIDDSRMEAAMESLAGEAEGLDSEDPRQAARLMRRLYGAMGMNLGPAMEEAMRRMEAGEDPDAIESEMGDLLESEDPFGAEGGGPGLSEGLSAFRKKLLKPKVDDTLYEL